MQQSIVKFYCFVVQTMLNMFRALLYTSSRARQTAIAASVFHMNVEVEVFSAVVGLCVGKFIITSTCFELCYRSSSEASKL